MKISELHPIEIGLEPVGSRTVAVDTTDILVFKPNGEPVAIFGSDVLAKQYVSLLKKDRDARKPEPDTPAPPTAQNTLANVVEALKFLADNDRPSGGEQQFNAAHLYQLAGELKGLYDQRVVRRNSSASIENAPDWNRHASYRRGDFVVHDGRIWVAAADISNGNYVPGGEMANSTCRTQPGTSGEGTAKIPYWIYLGSK